MWGELMPDALGLLDEEALYSAAFDDERAAVPLHAPASKKCRECTVNSRVTHHMIWEPIS